MNNNYFLEQAKKCVEQTTNEVLAEEMYIVWFCKTLQNWKALVSTDVINGVYWEVTHNGDTNETYVDMYTKTNNICVKGELKSMDLYSEYLMERALIEGIEL